MNNVFRRIVNVFIIGLLSVTIVALIFFRADFNSAQEITKADSLSGQRIGVVQAYEADYLLTNRSDVTLLRYESEGDSLVGLCYEQVDGLAYVEEAANYFLERTEGLKVIDGDLGQIGYTVLFSTKDEELLDEYNKWVSEFINSDECKDLKQKVDNSEITDGSKTTTEKGTGKTLKVGYLPDYLPISFLDTKQKIPNGVEVETIRMFANAYNYQIEWVECSEESALIDLTAGKLDMAAIGYTDVYREEIEDNDDCAMAMPHMYTSIKVLVVDDWDNLSITGFVEEEED